MCEYKLHIRGFLHHFERFLVLEHLAHVGEQIEVCITDTGNTEDEVRLFVTEVNAVRVLQHDNAGFLDGGFLFARAVRDGNAHAARQVAQKLRRREAMGDTYIKPLFALLLHCKTNAVSDCRFGYLQAQPPVYEAGKMIMGALVLLAPDTGDPAPVDVMRSVSAQLIEAPELMELLRTGQKEAAARLLEERLDLLFPGK